MSDPRPTRDGDGLKDVVEMLLDKGVVINADIVVSVGETELIGIRLRAALASFETAAKYGLEFPSGTDMQRVGEAAGVQGAVRGTAQSADAAVSGSEDDESDDRAEVRGRPEEHGIAPRVATEDPTADESDDEDVDANANGSGDEDGSQGPPEPEAGTGDDRDENEGGDVDGNSGPVEVEPEDRTDADGREAEDE
jgi:hypothetical protein